MEVKGYGVLITPGGSKPVIICSGRALTAMLMVVEAVVLFLSVTVTFTEYGLPATAVGVPEMIPVPEPMLNPGGNPVAVKVYGCVPPVAVIVAPAYGALMSPAGRVAGAEITSGGAITKL